MNKGLELMEAHHLFGTPYDRIDVVVHPQSIIHALVQLCDGSTKAHLGYPDMRVAIGYALHHPDRADLPIEPLDLIKLGRAGLRGARPRRVPVPAPGARGRGRGRDRAVRAQRRQRGRRARLPQRPPGLHRHPAGDRRRARASSAAHRVHDFEALYVTDSEARELADELIESERARMSWVLAFLGFAALVILHEAGHFFAAKAVGMRVERFALFFPPLIARHQAGRDRVRDRRDPARRLREDHRHEPGGGDPAGARPPRLLPPAGVEADRRDRRRPAGQHRARVRDPRRRLHVAPGTVEPPPVVGAIEQGTPAATALRAGRRAARRRRQAR